jgi:hypothetical protein
MKSAKQAGQGMVEYALLLLLGVIGTLLILQLAGISVKDVYCKVASGFKAGACVRDTAYCQDDFSNLNNWKNLTGPWKIIDGKACIQGGGEAYNKCSLSNMKESDYTVELDGAKLDAGNGYGIFFRSTLGSQGMNGYAFQYDPGLNGYVIRKWVNGKEINPPLAYKAVPGNDWNGSAHKISVKVQGDTFTCYVDGKPVLTATDNTYPTGGSGLRTWDSTIFCVDNFTIHPNQP